MQEVLRDGQKTAVAVRCDFDLRGNRLAHIYTRLVTPPFSFTFGCPFGQHRLHSLMMGMVAAASNRVFVLAAAGLPSPRHETRGQSAHK